MLRHIYVADRLALNNRNAKTKEIGVRMWRTAYANSTGGGGAEFPIETVLCFDMKKFKVDLNFVATQCFNIISST